MTLKAKIEATGMTVDRTTWAKIAGQIQQWMPAGSTVTVDGMECVVSYPTSSTVAVTAADGRGSGSVIREIFVRDWIADVEVKG